MQSMKTLCKAKLRLFITLLLGLSCFTACGCGTSPGKGAINKRDIKPLNRNPTPKNDQAIVLFHGLGDPVSALDDVKKELAAALKDTEIVAFQRDEQQGITAQANKIYQELQDQGLHQKELVFLGISAGGVVAIEVLNQHPELQKNLKLIIPYHSPLEGAPIAKHGVMVENLATQLEGMLRQIGQPGLAQSVGGIMVDTFKNITQTRAANDLVPNSTFMVNFKANLSKVKVPILALAGTKSNFESFIQSFCKPVLKKLRQDLGTSTITGILVLLDDPFSHLIGAKEHDALLPESSQLAKNISNTYIERIKQEGVNHFIRITPKVMDKIVKRIKACFNK